MRLTWDLFCRVIDNFGDIGVCWRLATDLGSRGHRVRLWTDDDRALAWMAPHGHPGVKVRSWQAAAGEAEPADVVIEAFACDPPPPFIAAMAARKPPPVWINLEYLSAEAWVERCHGLPSPRLVEPGQGLTKWFFHPGFNAQTGGLLREPGLIDERESFERDAWLNERLGITRRKNEDLVVAFCYDSTPLRTVCDALAAQVSTTPTLIALTPGPAQQTLAGLRLPDHVRTLALPWLSQQEFDRLLWSADFNLVRGEDSAVRAIWAGRPFVWQLYPQDDRAHHAKARAFLDTFFDVTGASPELASSIRAWWRTCNAMGGMDGMGDMGDMDGAGAGAGGGKGGSVGVHEGAALESQRPPAWPNPAQWQAWSLAARRFRDSLAGESSLTTRLIDFAATRMASGGRDRCADAH